MSLFIFLPVYFLSPMFRVCADAVPGPAQAEEPGAPDFVRAGAGLGGRGHEEPGERGLHVAGPHANRLQRGERRSSQRSRPHAAASYSYIAMIKYPLKPFSRLSVFPHCNQNEMCVSVAQP